MWKVSHVTPIFKSRKKAKISNYRPIGILCAITKAFEKTVASKLLFQVSNQITPKQHGYLHKTFL